MARRLLRVGSTARALSMVMTGSGRPSQTRVERISFDHPANDSSGGRGRVGSRRGSGFE